MNKQDLSGVWTLHDCESRQTIAGHLPGCNYLDLQNAGVVDDLFWGDNEEAAKELAYRDYEYSRSFILDDALVTHEEIHLVISGLDTLAEIAVNGHVIAETDNAYRLWRFSIKPYLNNDGGANELRIRFKNPLPYLDAKQQEHPVMLSAAYGIAKVQHIRKPLCNFGWDWAPQLAPCGVFGTIQLEGYTTARLSDVRIDQHHSDGRVSLNIAARIEPFEKDHAQLAVEARLIDPVGKVMKRVVEVDIKGQAALVLSVDDPQLWWCNGLGDQPLYRLEVYLVAENKDYLDSNVLMIGLRTIELNTEADRWGTNFQFRINGVPVFAKGANWVPLDSFITRTTDALLEFHIKSAQQANMNMLRVWGGGYYESDAFYQLCDEYGILVWQDIAFACASYPLISEQFLQSVKSEVEDNVRRLHHHASLALWCGNNEIKALSDISRKRSKELKEAEHSFFFTKLPNWIQQHDTITPYWPGSPTNGLFSSKKANSLHHGDTHLWQVWHGMQPLEALQKMPTRFCSEYGTESLPSVKTLLRFTDNPEIDLFDPIMLRHQKSPNGNEKMLYYILSRYPYPATTRDHIYLSQLIQAETVRLATEGWRRQMGRCNGALYWQYNDCWPTASWAGIEYEGEFKAVQYRAKHFNSMLTVFADVHKQHTGIYVANDYPDTKRLRVRWRISTFAGETVAHQEQRIAVPGYCAQEVHRLDYRKIINRHPLTDVVVVLELLNDNDVVLSKQSVLLVADKDAALQKATLDFDVQVHDAIVTLTLTANTFARHVHLTCDVASGPFSDNFFDIEKDRPNVITFPVKPGTTEKNIRDSLQVRSLADVQAKMSTKSAQKLRRSFFMKPKNLASYAAFKILL